MTNQRLRKFSSSQFYLPLRSPRIAKVNEIECFAACPESRLLGSQTLNKPDDIKRINKTITGKKRTFEVVR